MTTERHINHIDDFLKNYRVLNSGLDLPIVSRLEPMNDLISRLHTIEESASRSLIATAQLIGVTTDESRDYQPDAELLKDLSAGIELMSDLLRSAKDVRHQYQNLYRDLCKDDRNAERRGFDVRAVGVSDNEFEAEIAS